MISKNGKGHHHLNILYARTAVSVVCHVRVTDNYSEIKVNYRANIKSNKTKGCLVCSLPYRRKRETEQRKEIFSKTKLNLQGRR